MITEEKRIKAIKRNKFLTWSYMIIAFSFSILGVFHYPFFLLAIIGFLGVAITSSNTYFLVLSYQIQELGNKGRKKK